MLLTYNDQSVFKNPKPYPLKQGIAASPIVTFIVTLLISLLCYSATLSADTAQNSNPKDTPPANNGTMEWIKEKRNYWGKLVGDTGRRLDGFFASNEAITKSNNSFIKIALRATQLKSGHSKLDPLFKFRLDLPTLEERLKIVFESEADETRSLADKNIERTDKVESDISQSTIGAVKLESKKARRWGASTSVGVDFQLPPDYFWRSKAYYRWQISENWRFEPQQKLFYFHHDGWGETTRLTFEHNGDFVVFRSISEAQYFHKERRMEFAQTYSFLKELSRIRAINFQLGILGENKPKRQVTDYFINTIYRRKLSKEWLFYEMTPTLLFPREEDFKMVPSITAKIEIVFSSS